MFIFEVIGIFTIVVLLVILFMLLGIILFISAASKGIESQGPDELARVLVEKDKENVLKPYATAIVKEYKAREKSLNK